MSCVYILYFNIRYLCFHKIPRLSDLRLKFWKKFYLWWAESKNVRGHDTIEHENYYWRISVRRALLWALWTSSRNIPRHECAIFFFFVKNHSFPFGFFFVSEQFHVPVVLCISEGGGIHWRRRAYSIISPDLRTESQARPAYENLFGKKVDIGVSAPSNNTSIKRFFSSISFLLGRTMSFRWTPWMGRCAAVGPTGRAWRWGSCARSACRRRRQRRWGSSRAAARSSRPGARHKASVWFWIDRGLARFHRVLQDYKLFSIIY